MSIFQDYKFRQWLYGIAAAVLVLLGGYGFFTAEEQQNILTLITAILNLGGAAALSLAGANARPSAQDGVVEHRGKYGDYTEET